MFAMVWSGFAAVLCDVAGVCLMLLQCLGWFSCMLAMVWFGFAAMVCGVVGLFA